MKIMIALLVVFVCAFVYRKPEFQSRILGLFGVNKQSVKQGDPTPKPTSDNTTSTDLASLRRKMQVIGVKVYGSMKCGWSVKQHQLLGITAADNIFVDCDQNPDQCGDVQAFPTWEINGIRRAGFMNINAVRDLLDGILQDTFTKHNTASDERDVVAPMPAVVGAQPPDTRAPPDIMEVIDEESGTEIEETEEEKEAEREGNNIQREGKVDVTGKTTETHVSDPPVANTKPTGDTPAAGVKIKTESGASTAINKGVQLHLKKTDNAQKKD